MLFACGVDLFIRDSGRDPWEVVIHSRAHYFGIQQMRSLLQMTIEANSVSASYLPVDVKFEAISKVMSCLRLQTSNAIHCLVLSVFLIVGATSDRAFGQDVVKVGDKTLEFGELSNDEKITILNNIAQGEAAGKKLLRTIRAQGEFTRKARGSSQLLPRSAQKKVGDKGVYRIVHGTFDFSFDSAREATYGEVKENGDVEWSDVASSNTVGKTFSGRGTRWQITPQYYSHLDETVLRGNIPGFDPMRGLQPKGGLVIDVAVKETSHKNLDLLCEPSTWYCVQFMPVYELFSAWAAEVTKPDGNESFREFFKDRIRISTGADSIVVLSQMKERPLVGVISSIYTLTGAPHYLPLSYQLHSGDKLSWLADWEWQYASDEHVPVLAKFHKLLMERDGSAIAFEESMTLTEVEVNQPLRPEIFELRHLAKQPGVRVHNQIVGSLSVVNDTGELIDIHDWNKRTPSAKVKDSGGAAPAPAAVDEKPSTNVSRTTVLVWITLVMVTTGLALAVWRASRSMRGHLQH